MILAAMKQLWEKDTERDALSGMCGLVEAT